MISEGYVQMQKHPEAELFIYNYTSKAQYDRVWNDVTLQCRGLIVDASDSIIARPFRKFFNLDEMENQCIPNEPFDVYEKMDGSLGILYWLNNKPFIATRGSFSSEQSVKANEMLNEKYAHAVELLQPNRTYLFEIIYPQNRIVVDYGEKEELVMLAVIDTESGEELALEEIGFPLVKTYSGINDIFSLKQLEEKNKEGFVIKFKGGQRYKIKFEEYVRIHRIVTGVSSITVWEYLREGKPLDELLERVPDEFYNWVKKTEAELKSSFIKIEETAKSEFKIAGTRKDTALYFLKCSYPSVLFNLLDKKNYKETIWKMLRPEYERPFEGIAEE